MNTQSPIRKGRKFDQVLDGAREVFMRDGFEGASVDDVARVAGVSKATLYSYFSDKRQLFIEVVRCECERMAEETIAVLPCEAPIREVLLTAAVRITRFLVSDCGQSIFRICVAERDRFPELGEAFYESGPKKGCEHTSAFLREAMDRGELEIDDMQMAAEQFGELCKVGIFMRAAFGVQRDFSDAEIERVATNAVETFMARYGTKR